MRRAEAGTKCPGREKELSIFKRAATLLGITFIALAISHGAVAQMGGGGMGNGGQGGCGTGPGGGTGGSGGPGMGGGMGPGGQGMNGGGLVVAPDGTAYVTSRTPSTTAGTAGTSVLVAVGKNGTRAWEWSAVGGIREPILAGSLVITAVGARDGDETPEATVVALQAASGTEAWRATVDGHAARLEAAGDRVLALVVKPKATGMGAGSSSDPDRTLVAIDLTGTVLWSFSLDD